MSFHHSIISKRRGGQPPAMLTRPSVAYSSLNVGDTLTATPGTYSNTPSSYVRQWKRSGVDISGATGLTYILTIDDQGEHLSFYEKAINGFGDSGFIRGETGLPRIFAIDGDSITSAASWPELLQSALGSTWNIDNYAVSAQNVAAMIGDAATEIDPSVDAGWGLSLGWEFINQAASSTGAEIYALLEDYNAARAAAGWSVVRASDFHINAACQVAGDLMRTNYPGLIELDLQSLRDDSNTVDDIHLTATGEAIIAGVVEDWLAANGYVGGCGAIPIPAVPATANLRTYSNPAYVYDPVNPLPATIPFGGPGGCWLHVTGGPGWTPQAHLVGGLINDFATADGPQRLYNISPGEGGGGLSGGTYFFHSSATPP